MKASLQSLMGNFFDYQMKGINIAIPAIVVDVSRLDESIISVRPSIDEIDKIGNSFPWPDIVEVPVQFPSGGQSAITFPLFKRDSVLLVFSMRSLDNFKNSTSDTTQASDYRMMDIRDAIAIPCVWPKSKSKNNPRTRTLPHSVSDLAITHNIGTSQEAKISIGSDGVITIKGSGIILDAPQMNVSVDETIWNGNISHSGQYSISGNMYYNGVEYKTHTHLGVTSGNSTSGGVA